MRPASSNSQFSLPYERNQLPESSCHSYARCSARLRHLLSTVYANETRSGSRLFHASSAARTFCVAVSRVNGGTGGRTGLLFMSVLGEAECSLTKGRPIKASRMWRPHRVEHRLQQ